MCATDDEHKSHEKLNMDIIFEKFKSTFKSDLNELKELSIKYRKIKSNILDMNCVHNKKFETFSEVLKSLGEDNQKKKNT